MMATKTPQSIALDIEAEIVAAYLNRSATVFWADQFSRHGIGRMDVMSGMRILEHCGKVEAQASLMCPNGHTLWHGPVSGLELYIKSVRSCRYCNAKLDPEDAPVEVQYHLTNDWQSRIERTREVVSVAKKKTR